MMMNKMIKQVCLVLEIRGQSDWGTQILASTSYFFAKSTDLLMSLFLSRSRITLFETLCGVV